MKEYLFPATRIDEETKRGLDKLYLLYKEAEIIKAGVFSLLIREEDKNGKKGG